MSQSEPTLRAGAPLLEVPAHEAATVQACRLSKVSFAALVACPIFALLGLVLYGLPAVLFMITGGGSMMSFSSCANLFTVPAACAFALGFLSLLFAAVGYFVVFFNRK
ncbi:hypothetical protein ACSYDW_00835 [Paeniglutamicibacter sp. R2-26]|uniref:hypothetical protein n=1 Tax=Paeniglutamicibacter sp. R2-26 TaxID=3144417 RepID=UPI003EE4FF58